MKLTRTENQVLRLTLDGFSEIGIRAKLAMTPGCYRVHLCNLRRKLGKHDLRGAKVVERDPML